MVCHLQIWFSSIHFPHPALWVSVGWYWKQTQNGRKPHLQTSSIINNSAADYSTLLKCGIDIDYVRLHELQTLNVKRLKVKVKAWRNEAKICSIMNNSAEDCSVSSNLVQTFITWHPCVCLCVGVCLSVTAMYCNISLCVRPSVRPSVCLYVHAFSLIVLLLWSSAQMWFCDWVSHQAGLPSLCRHWVQVLLI